MAFNRLYQRTLCLLGAFLLLLPGCGLKGESAQVKNGRKLMKEYLATLSGSSVLSDVHADVLRPDADKLVLSDYVKGSFKRGDQTYEITVNTVTGEVWTSERISELAEHCAAFVENRLRLNTADCVAVSSITVNVPAWQEENSDYPDETAYLGHVVPVAVTDLDAWAAHVLEDENTRTMFYIVCRGVELYDGRWSSDVISGWNSTEVMVYAIDADEPLPTPAEVSSAYVGNYAGDHFNIKADSVYFRAREAE